MRRETPFDLDTILANLDKKIAEKRKSGEIREEIPIRTHTINESFISETPQQESEKTNESRIYIESNKETVSNVLTKLIKENKVILVGEIHNSECDDLRIKVATSLPTLQKEGLTHIALETDSTYQEVIDSVDYTKSDEDIIKNLRENGVGNGWDNLTFGILIMAKRFKIKVILIDDPKRAAAEQAQGYVKAQNIRDAHMANVVINSLDENSKMLVYIGSDHTEDIKGSSVKRLRSHLSDTYGDEQISSIRNVRREDPFDCTYNGPTPNEIFKTTRGRTSTIVPDAGPLKGNRNTEYINFVN